MTKSNPEDCAKYIRGPPEWIRSDSLFEGRTEKWIISDSLSQLAQMRPTWRRIPASHTDREVTYKTAVWHVCGAVGRHSRTAYYKRVKLTTHKITIIWDNVYILKLKGWCKWLLQNFRKQSPQKNSSPRRCRLLNGLFPVYSQPDWRCLPVPSKAGKSWLTLWLCLQIAQGNPVWNREIEPRTVIYFSLEDTCTNGGQPAWSCTGKHNAGYLRPCIWQK